MDCRNCDFRLDAIKATVEAIGYNLNFCPHCGCHISAPPLSYLENDFTKNLRKQITILSRRLNRLKEKQASQGYETPVSVITEIEDIEAELEELKAELASYQ